MTNTDSLFQTRGKHEIASTPEGHDAFVIGGAVSRGAARTLLHVCRDDGRMARTLQALQFFYPDIEIVSFPAWDCLPYDRVSPNAEMTSPRIDALTRLIEASDTPRIVLTTMNAALQRVPPRKAFEDRVLRLAVRGSLPVARLISFL